MLRAPHAPKGNIEFGTHAREQHEWMVSEMHSICNGAQHGALGRHPGRGHWNSGSAAHQGDLQAGPCPPCGQRPSWGSCPRSLLHLRNTNLRNVTNHIAWSICRRDWRIPTEGAFECQSTQLQDVWLSMSKWLSVTCMPVAHHHSRLREVLLSQACLLVMGKFHGKLAGQACLVCEHCESAPSSNFRVCK